MLRLFVTALLLFSTVVASHAELISTSVILGAWTGPNNKICTEIEITVWDRTVSEQDGTVYHKLVGRSKVLVGDCELIAPYPNPNCPPVQFHGATLYTDITSPTCVSVWLNEAGVGDLVAAAIDEVTAGQSGSLSRKVSGVATETGSAAQLSIYPNPAKNVLSIRTQGKDAAAAEMRIFDATGKLVYRANKMSDLTPTSSFMIRVADYARGTYSATLRLENGRTVTTKFVLD